MPRTKIISFDPGGDTGVIIAYVNVLEMSFVGYEYTKENYPNEVYHEILERDLNDILPHVIVCESFDNRADPSTSYISSEYIGVIHYYSQKYRIPITLQKPAKAVGPKAFWTNDKLKAIGLYKPGKTHQKT